MFCLVFWFVFGFSFFLGSFLFFFFSFIFSGICVFSFFFFHVFFAVAFWSFFELFGDVSDGCPFFSVFFLLSAHLDEESSAQNFLIEFIPDEIDGVNFGFEDDFEGSGVIFFDFDEVEFREGFADIFFHCVKVALDEIE